MTVDVYGMACEALLQWLAGELNKWKPCVRTRKSWRLVDDPHFALFSGRDGDYCGTLLDPPGAPRSA